MRAEDIFGALDFTTSAATGLTRAHWIRTADHLLDGVRPFRSTNGAHYDLPGGPARAGVRSDGLEGFARTFLMAAFRSAGTGDSPHIADYAAGLAHGPSGHGSERWQEISHVGWNGQPMVESASIAIGMLVDRAHTWDQLDAGEQDRLEQWLRGALTHQPAHNNWYLFPLSVAAFLESVGRGDRDTARAIEQALSLLERWYRGDGWYSDGAGRAFDHYIGWAFHLYPPLLAAQKPGSIGIGADAHRAFAARVGERLEQFHRSYAETFDANGAPMYVGRSLTYRFGTTAAFGAGAATGRLGIDPGRARRIASSALRYFLERGALSGGVLSRGWHGGHGASLQDYSGPASPYWASKAFVALLAPEESPFWTAPESADDEGERTVAIPPAGWLVQRTSDGHVRLHNHGSDHVAPGAPGNAQSDPLYARYAYSTRTGPTATRNVPDNHVSLVLRGIPSVRHEIEPIATGADWAASWHRPWFATPIAEQGGQPLPPMSFPSSLITAATVAHGSWDVRIFRTDEVPLGTEVRVSGWALGCASPADVDTVQRERSVRLSVEEDSSELVLLHGMENAEFTAERAPQGTAYASYALVPRVAGELSGLVVVAARTSTTGPGEAAPRVRVAGGPADSDRADTDTVTIDWSDGTQHAVRIAERQVIVE